MAEVLALLHRAPLSAESVVLAAAAEALGLLAQAVKAASVEAVAVMLHRVSTERLVALEALVAVAAVQVLRPELAALAALQSA